MASAERKTSTSSMGKEYGHSSPYGALFPVTREHKFDRGWAWAVDIGVLMVSFLIVGWFRCYGLVFLAIQDLHYDTNYKTSWVGTSNAVCFNLFAPVGSLLADRFSNRCVVMTGGLLMSASLIAGYFVSSLTAYIITIGVMHGIGAALAYVPSVVMLGTYFRKRMGLATGLAFAGSSLSQLIMPFLLTTLLDRYGLHGSLLILGGLALNVCVSGALFYPVPVSAIKQADDQILRQLAMDDLKKQREQNPIVKKEAVIKPSQPPITEEGEDEVFIVPAVTKIEDDERKEDEPLEGRYKKQRRASSSSIGAGRRASRSMSIQLPARLRRFSVRRFSMTLTSLRRGERLRSVVRNLESPVLWMLMIGYAVGAFIFAAGMKYIPPHAREQGLTQPELTLMLFLCGLPDILARVGVGLALDTRFVRTRFQRYRIFGLAILTLGLASLALPFTRSFAACLCAFLVFGLGVGAFFTSSSVACFDLMGRERYSLAYGWMLFLASITHLVDSVAVAQLRDVTGDYLASFLLMAVAGVVASLCMFSQQILLKLRPKHPEW